MSGLLTAETWSYDVRSNRTVECTVMDRANKTVARLVCAPDSTNAAAQVTVNGLAFERRLASATPSEAGRYGEKRNVERAWPGFSPCFPDSIGFRVSRATPRRTRRSRRMTRRTPAFLVFLRVLRALRGETLLHSLCGHQYRREGRGAGRHWCHSGDISTINH